MESETSLAVRLLQMLAEDWLRVRLILLKLSLAIRFMMGRHAERMSVDSCTTIGPAVFITNA